MRYVVQWEIDADAENPRTAAEQAFAAMQRPGTTATVFTVLDESGEATQVDLLEQEG